MDWGEILNRAFEGLGRFVEACIRNWRITLLVIFVFLVLTNWTFVWTTTVVVATRLFQVGIVLLALTLLFKPVRDFFFGGGRKKD